MRPNFMLIAGLVIAPLAMLGMLTACEEKQPPAGSPTSAPPAKTGNHDHDHDHDHDHNADGSHTDDKAHSSSGPGHGGGIIDLLGSAPTAVGPFTITKASRDKSDIIAGKDAAFDVTLAPTEGAGVKTAAVRFWIGTEDAKGSVKAKAEVEDPKDPNRWHVHAEVPSPLPAGSKFWFEIEDDKGATHVGSFDLKM